MALVALCFQQDPTETIPPASLPASARAPRPADGRVQVAMRAYEQRDYQRAERELRAGLEIEPERADILVRLGIVLYRMKRWGDAIPYLTKGVEKEQNSLGDMQVIGHCYYELGQTEEALDWYNRVIAAKKTNREAWRGKGFALERLGKYPEAEEALRTAVALNPDSAPAHLWLGRVLTKQKKAGAAIPYLEKAKKLNAFDWETEYELSRAYLALGETARSRASKERSDFLRGHAERINELKSKLLSSPRDIGIITLLAAQYDAIGDVLNAKQAWDQARNLSRDDPAVTIAHAASLFATGAGATAEELLRAKLRERPADPTLWEVLWYVLRERGDQKGAAEAASRVKQILNRDPQVPEIFAKKPEPPASSPAPPGDRKDD
jgi:tetratricopeptide (TPR) repeat protein